MTCKQKTCNPFGVIGAGSPFSDGDGDVNATWTDGGNGGSAKEFNLATSSLNYLTLNSATCAITFINPSQGVTYKFKFIQDATGGRAITMPANFKGNPSLDTSASTSNKVDYMQMEYDGTNFLQTGLVYHIY